MIASHHMNAGLGP